MKFTNKLIKLIRFVAIILSVLIIVLAIIWTQEQVNFIKNTTDNVVTQHDEIILEWTADYADDAALLERIDKNLNESEARINEMIRQCEIILGDK